MYSQILLTLCEHSLLELGSYHVAFSFANNSCQYVGHAWNQPYHSRIAVLRKLKIMDTLLKVIHQQNVNRSGCNTLFSQTLQMPSPVLLSTSRCSQTPLELSKVLSDSPRAFSGASESTCSYGGAFRMLRDFPYGIVKIWNSWDLCADLWETSKEAETTGPFCGRFGAVFSWRWFLLNHKAFHHITFVFVPVTRFATSWYGIHN